MAGLLALGVAACGDNVEVIQPTPPVVPPPPPVTATMAPASASVAVGNSVVFAVNASGGVSGEAASWTCASSNTGIATVSSTSAGCQATGVVAGSVTITASVSKSGETVNVGAELTVTSDVTTDGDPAFILIGSVTDGTPNDGSLSGYLNVVLNVDPGDQTLEEILVLVDGEVVSTQAFGEGMAMAPPEEEDEAAEQAGALVFTLSFNSGEYDLATGATTFANGEHAILGEVIVSGSGGMERRMVASNIITAEFDNTDGVHLDASAPGGSALDSNGSVWYGGPGTTLDITAVPVVYSGGSADAVTMLGFCGADAESVEEAPFVFAPDCEDEGATSEGVTPEFTAAIGGSSANLAILNHEDDIFPINLDYEGPGAPRFRPNRNSRQGGWINEALALTSTSSRNANSWLAAGAADEGVGGRTTQLRVGGDFDEALAAAASSSPTLPDASRNNDDYCFIASALDDLGNESALPDEDDGACESDDDYADLLTALSDANKAVEDVDADDISEAQQDDIDDAIDDLVEAGLLAGVDVEAPQLSFTTSASSPLRSAREFQVQASDAGRGRSGIHSTAPVLARVELRNVDETLCGIDIRTEGEEDDSNTATIPGDPDEDCENTSGGLTVTDAGGAAKLATTDVFQTGTNNEIGFYTFTAQARDKAGNLSEEIDRVVLNDTEAPSVGITARVPSDGVDGAFDVTILMADNLSLRDIRGNGTYGAGDDPATAEYSIRLTGAPIDAFNAPQLTQEHILQLGDVQPLLRLYNMDDISYEVDADDADDRNFAPTDEVDLNGIAIRLRDQKGAAAHDTTGISVAASLTPFDYTLTAVPTTSTVVDDPATTDVNENAVALAGMRK